MFKESLAATFPYVKEIRYISTSRHVGNNLYMCSLASTAVTLATKTIKCQMIKFADLLNGDIQAIITTSLRCDTAIQTIAQKAVISD